MSGIDVDDSSVARMALCYMFFLTSFITSSGLLYPKHIFAHNQALVNTVCPSKDVVLNVTLESGIHCSAMCTRTGTCRSFMYNRDLKQCVLCRERFSSSGELTNANGFQLYSDTTRNYHLACSTNSDCKEINNICEQALHICVCTPGYSYHPGTMTCVAGCSTYGTTYEYYPQFYMVGLNDEIIHSVSYQFCVDHCANAGYTCRSFERMGESCWFSSANALTHPTQYQYWTTSKNDFYNRNCA